MPPAGAPCAPAHIPLQGARMLWSTPEHGPRWALWGAGPNTSTTALRCDYPLVLPSERWGRGGSMIGTDRLNVPTIDTFSHRTISVTVPHNCSCPLLGSGAPLSYVQAHTMGHAGGRKQVNKALHTCTSWYAYAAMFGSSIDKQCSAVPLIRWFHEHFCVCTGCTDVCLVTLFWPCFVGQNL